MHPALSALQDPDGRTLIMGILNVTPDSFSDGGCFLKPDDALRHAEHMLAAGADIIDIGGESTRPGAAAVTVEEELERVCPVVEAVAGRLGAAVSVDTSQPQVMAACARLGAGLWNDIRALQAEGAEELAARLEVAVCLMHMQGTPSTMQQAPHYRDVAGEVTEFLTARAAALEARGVPRWRIILDPGFGFGKSTQDNYVLLDQLPRLCAAGYAVLAGMSRKSMIGAATGVAEPARRLGGSVAAALLAVMKGARIVRVHDVEATRQALAVHAQLRECTHAP